MPLPTDEKVMETSQGVVDVLRSLAGPHPSFRPAHAKGTILSGTFKPTAAAASLSAGKHFHDASSPVTVRFSNSTGVPQIPDTDPNASPQGFAVRFHLGLDANGRRVHTDIIAHSTPFFPASTGEEFLGLFQAIAQTGPDSAHPTPVEQFLGSHPKALAFIQAPKPLPVSLATQAFYSVTAFKLVSAEGKETYVRYRVVPALGHQTLDAEASKEQGPNYLYDDIKQRVQAGPVVFKLTAQIAEAGDVTDNATEQWPESRQLVELGEITVDALVPEEDNAAQQKTLIFDPIPRIKGVEPSADPLLDVRAAVYLISGRKRREA